MDRPCGFLRDILDGPSDLKELFVLDEVEEDASGVGLAVLASGLDDSDGIDLDCDPVGRRRRGESDMTRGCTGHLLEPCRRSGYRPGVEMKGQRSIWSMLSEWYSSRRQDTRPPADPLMRVFQVTSYCSSSIDKTYTCIHTDSQGGLAR